jgi:hypothetical protein
MSSPPRIFGLLQRPFRRVGRIRIGGSIHDEAKVTAAEPDVGKVPVAHGHQRFVIGPAPSKKAEHGYRHA